MPQFFFCQKSQVSTTSLVGKLGQLKIGGGIFGMVDSLP